RRRDRQFVIDRRHLSDVVMKRLPLGHKRKPPADQTRRQRGDQPQLVRAGAEGIHGNSSKDSNEDVSQVENGHRLTSNHYGGGFRMQTISRAEKRKTRYRALRHQYASTYR